MSAQNGSHGRSNQRGATAQAKRLHEHEGCYLSAYTTRPMSARQLPVLGNCLLSPLFLFDSKQDICMV